MGLTIYADKDNHHALGREYNVEYELGNGKTMTFSNRLENADNTYFWFLSKEYGLDIIRQDRIVTMTCNRKPYNKT